MQSFKEKQYENEEFERVLKSFDVKQFKDFLKKFSRKSYKKFVTMNYATQKLIMCQCIIDNEKVLDKELVKKAKDYQNGIEMKGEAKK